MSSNSNYEIKTEEEFIYPKLDETEKAVQCLFIIATHNIVKLIGNVSESSRGIFTRWRTTNTDHCGKESTRSRKLNIGENNVYKNQNFR